MNAIDDAAFGAAPGRWPLPAPTTPEERWLHAVAAGGQGRYASAFADLDELTRLRPFDSLASRALSTRASFLRQLGGHDAARVWDGRAWARSGGDVDAGTDALIGLAADALGVGRFATSDRLLSRAEELLGGEATGRLPVRLAWVRAELAMFTGDGAAAVAYARRAIERVAQLNSARHAVKSQVVLAAAWCSAGELTTARRVADGALAATAELGLIPLGWALACLLADIGSTVHSPAGISAMRDDYAGLIGRRGGTWTAR